MITPAVANDCELGEGKGKQVVVLGDSYALAWLPGIEEALDGSEWNVDSLAMGQCPAMSVTVTKDAGEAYPECNDHRKWALDQVKSIKPDLVIVGDADNTLYRLASGNKGSTALSEVEEGLATTLSAVAPHAKKTVVLAPPPPGESLQECATRVSRPSDCIGQIGKEWIGIADRMKSATRSEKAGFIDTRMWFCDVRGWCPAFVGNTPVRVDTGHLTIEYARSVSPLLKEALSDA